ncbi:MAG: glutamate N-acetyltransferase/amino-acid N-acetyltransferase [Cellvibrionaceae bacterium]|jgi:glutamate N-acetyltransferase/amino-acid N-acetyltransferase
MNIEKITFPPMPPIPGVRLNAVSADIKKQGQLDLTLVELPENTMACGLFTQNIFCAAPVTVCKNHLEKTHNSRYLLINSGNANACTGEEGMTAAQRCSQQLAAQANVSVNQVLPFSTGVIGEPLPTEKICQSLPLLMDGLDENHWDLAAKGIMTTDTCPKGATQTIVIDGEPLIVNGIAKGAGMIKPNMATMLAYIVTNAQVSAELLQATLKEANDLSFNRITIDGDTSTNDSVILAATGKSAIALRDPSDEHYLAFRQAVITVFQTLAQSIIRDGEGATKFVSITVAEGSSSQQCLSVAYAIAQSPLVKTALFASDPNWGRIVAAIGYADARGLNPQKIKIFLDDVLIVENGGRAASYRESEGQRVMSRPEINIRVGLACGDFSETVWTTDLSYDYIKINAEYRT